MIESVTVNTHPLARTLPTFDAVSIWSEVKDKAVWNSICSFPYALALTIYGVTPGPEWAKEETMHDPKILEMTKKITHGEHPEAMKMTAEWKGHPGKLFSQPPTSIEVVSAKGTFTAESTDIPGDSWNPKAKMSEEEIIAKFRNNSSHMLSDAQVSRVAGTIRSLEEVNDISEFTRLLTP